MRASILLRSSFGELVTTNQDIKSAKNYIAQFDEFLICYNALGTESNVQVLSRFRVGHRKDLRTSLLARGVTKFERLMS